ncbi:extracellular solute-binding protein [Albidovulum sediminicola]
MVADASSGRSETGARLTLGLAAVLALAAPSGLRAEGTVITSHAITTFGDAPKYPSDFKHLDYVNPDAPKGGEISEATFGTFDSFNPYTQKGRAAALANIAYEEMMVGTADEVGAMYCLICKTIEYPQDKAWVIFHMRPEARFSDGSPMTAEDVAFTYALFRDEGLISFRTVLAEYVESVEVLDDHRIKYVFKPESSPRERIQMAGGLPVMSKAWFEKTGAKLDESRMEPGVGSGPYVLESFDVNQRVIYKRNPDYWGKDLPISIGQNNFDRIRIEYFGDATSALEGLKAGAYTFRNENSSKNWATAYDIPAVEKGWLVKQELKHGNIANGQSFVLNLRREKFQDPRVREAIGLMFNFEWSNESLFYGLYRRINSFWENSELAAQGLPSPEELALLEPLKDQLPPGVLDQEPAMAPVSGERQLDRKNLRKAAALLEAAGWIVGDDGIRRNARGEMLSIEFLEDDPAFDRIVNPFIENLRALGVDATLNRVDPAQYTKRVRPDAANAAASFDFDIITDQFPTGYEPGAGLKQYFGTEGLADVFNTMGLSDPAADALIEKVIAAQSKDEMHVAVKALDRVLRAHRFWVPQWFKDSYTVAYYDMYRHPDPLPPFALGELSFWWYDADRAAALKSAGALN